MQSAGQSSGAVQQLPGYYTIPPQQLLPYQLPPTGFTGHTQGIDVHVSGSFSHTTIVAGNDA